MSRIGETPILIPDNVTVNITGKTLVVSGPKGELSQDILEGIKVEQLDNSLVLKRKSDKGNLKAMHGLERALISNMTIGVSKGWSRRLELLGVGFRAQLIGDKLVLNVGYSHPIEISAPEKIEFSVTDNTKIEVSGIDKQLVGQVAANIRKVKPPDVYKGKGIRFEG